MNQLFFGNHSNNFYNCPHNKIPAVVYKIQKPIRLNDKSNLKKLGEQNQNFCNDCCQRICTCIWSKLVDSVLNGDTRLFKLYSPLPPFSCHSARNDISRKLNMFNQGYSSQVCYNYNLHKDNSIVWILRPHHLHLSSENLLLNNHSDRGINEILRKSSLTYSLSKDEIQSIKNRSKFGDQSRVKPAITAGISFENEKYNYKIQLPSKNKKNFLNENQRQQYIPEHGNQEINKKNSGNTFNKIEAEICNEYNRLTDNKPNPIYYKNECCLKEAKSLCFKDICKQVSVKLIEKSPVVKINNQQGNCLKPCKPTTNRIIVKDQLVALEPKVNLTLSTTAQPSSSVNRLKDFQELHLLTQNCQPKIANPIFKFSHLNMAHTYPMHTKMPTYEVEITLQTGLEPKKNNGKNNGKKNGKKNGNKNGKNKKVKLKLIKSSKTKNKLPKSSSKIQSQKDLLLKSQSNLKNAKTALPTVIDEETDLPPLPAHILKSCEPQLSATQLKTTCKTVNSCATMLLNKCTEANSCTHQTSTQNVIKSGIRNDSAEERCTTQISNIKSQKRLLDYFANSKLRKNSNILKKGNFNIVPKGYLSTSCGSDSDYMISFYQPISMNSHHNSKFCLNAL